MIDPRPLLITGDFNFHVDNKSDVDANNFSDLLESFNLHIVLVTLSILLSQGTLKIFLIHLMLLMYQYLTTGL